MEGVVLSHLGVCHVRREPRFQMEQLGDHLARLEFDEVMRSQHKLGKRQLAVVVNVTPVSRHYPKLDPNAN